MKRIIAFTLACLLASPAWAGDFPNPGSASHRARDDGWIDVDKLPGLCDNGYNICKETGDGGGLILHSSDEGVAGYLSLLNDTSNQIANFWLGDGGQLYINGFANLHFVENGTEDITFNEGWINPPFERGLEWPGENIRLRSVDDGNFQIAVDGGDHGILELYDDNAASINNDEPYNINVYSSNDDDEDINVGGITWIWDDVALNTEDTRIIFFTTVNGDDYVDQLQISNGVTIGDTDHDPGTGNLAVGSAGSVSDLITFLGGSLDPGSIIMSNDDAGSSAPWFLFLHDMGDPDVGDHIIALDGFGRNDAAGIAPYGGMLLQTKDVTNNSEDGQWYFYTTIGGADEQAQIWFGSGVTVGSADYSPGQGFLSVGAPGSAGTPGGRITVEPDGEGVILGAWPNGATSRPLVIGTSPTAENPGTFFGPGLALGDNTERDTYIYRGDGPGTEGPGVNLEVPSGAGIQHIFTETYLANYQEDTDNIVFEAQGDGSNVSLSLVPKGSGSVRACFTGHTACAAVKFAGYQHMALMAGAGTVPAGGGIAGCTPVSAFDSGSNDIFLRQCSFSASADNAIYFTVPFPESSHLATDLDVYVRWTSATTTDGSDAVIWNATAVCFSDDDSINANAFPAVDAVTDTQTAAGDILSTVTGGSAMSLTPAGSPTDFDTCVIRVSRDADNGSDTFNGTADLISVDLYFVDDLPNES